jgi:hypothetical protein
MKKKTPNGKISRLPHHIREEINSRLRDRQPGKPIVAWLNSLPEVKEVLSVSFGGRPIDEGNLSEWKKRHHPAWLLQQAAFAQTAHFLAESRQLAQAGQGALTDHLATFVAARYALATRQLSDQVEESEHWKLLRALCHDVVRLRRGDHLAESLRLQRQLLQMRQHNNPFPIPHDSHS